jgi:luciferase family oxidoreductase group 1
MKKQLSSTPVSILDLATIVEGDQPADAFRKSLAQAQHAEANGCLRYWFAEHHNMESVASAATSVLIAYVAAGTTTLRVGSGGIMLPNHAPLVVAEQFGTLEALFPGRIDLGIGRAPGTDPVTSMALRRNIRSTGDEFPSDVVELIKYLGPFDPAAKVRAIPGEGSQVPVWLLGSSIYSAQLAAVLGLPYAFASHFAPTYLLEALEIYRQYFKPSAFLKQPYTIACVNVMAADSDEEAEFLATSFYGLALGLIRNNRRPLQPPVSSMESLWTDYEKAAVKQMMLYSFIGSSATVENDLSNFLQTTGVNEIMIASHFYDYKAKMKSFEMVAQLFKRSTAAQEQVA